LAYELRDNSGSLFKNDKKETESHPNATGKVMVAGVEYWISAWTKEGAKGKFQSLAFKPCEQQPMTIKQAGAVPKNFPDLDDDIPF
jgi:hypothetical protein